MKMTRKVFGIIALVAVMGFMVLPLTGCPDAGDDPTPTPTMPVIIQPDVIIPSDAIQLTANTWEDSNLTTSSDEQWFKFTATASTQYIHTYFGSSSEELYVQVYDSRGFKVGSGTNLSSGAKNISRSVTIGQEYYIKVSSSNYLGAYKIGFNDLPFSPDTIGITTITQLTADTWADVNLLTKDDVQWFKFTATASTQYIHVYFGTLRTPSVQVYDSSGATVGSWNNSSQLGTTGTTRNFSQSVTIGQEYYIKGQNWGTVGGTYKIGYTTSVIPPGATTLTADTWADGELPTNASDQWFKFTATASTQYIYVDFGTLNNLNVNVYNSSGNSVGYTTQLTGSTKNTSQSVTIGQEYYIKVNSYLAGYSGTYKIGFTALPVPPGTPITQLTADTWADGNLPTSSDVQLFKFTATASTQYIHVCFGTLTRPYVEVYDLSGVTVGYGDVLAGDAGGISNTTKSVTIGQEYYIKVSANDSRYSGTYKIGFNALPCSPETTQLTTDTWEDGELSTNAREQWFKFTATASTQFIHADTSTTLYGSVYDSSGVMLKNREYLTKAGKITLSVTIGQEYYIQVKPFSESYNGTYKIGFTALPFPPDTIIIQLTADTWADGNLPTYSDVQWFKFTATASTQYIHVYSNKMSGPYVVVYDSSGGLVGSRTSQGYVECNNSLGQEYYINVLTYDSSYSGTYKIGFTDSTTEPN